MSAPAAPPSPSVYAHTHALTRRLPTSFLDALTMQPPEEPIDLKLAQQQLADYVILVRELVGHCHEVPADETTPDCCFIEDTAIVLGTAALRSNSAIAILTHPGAESRRAEVGPVRAALESLGFSNQPDAAQPHRLLQLQPPAELDGGDVLYAGRSSGLWVGLSARTNIHAVQQLSALLEGICPVHGLEVAAGPGLHLKSLMSALSEDLILVADIPEGRTLVTLAQAKAGAVQGQSFVYVPDMICSNVLRIGPHVVMQAGYPGSEAIIRSACDQRGLQLHCLPFKEFAKADGALTCCSLLFSLDPHADRPHAEPGTYPN